MIKVSMKEMDKVAPFFEGWEETMIWSCLQGIKGNAWLDNKSEPRSAQIITGDLCFFAGTPNPELVKNIPEYFKSEYIYMIPQNEAWAEVIEQVYGDRSERFMRYAIKKEPDVFNKAKLKAYSERLPEGYSIAKIDEKLYEQIMQTGWARDLCVQFPTYDSFNKYAIGYVALYENEVVSGASSYTVYNKGIEIEIDTKEEHRRKGLALACAATLILDCLSKGLYPSWDAANKESVALSEKLGYHFDKEYVTYAIKVGKE